MPFSHVQANVCAGHIQRQLQPDCELDAHGRQCLWQHFCFDDTHSFRFTSPCDLHIHTTPPLDTSLHIPGLSNKILYGALTGSALSFKTILTFIAYRITSVSFIAEKSVTSPRKLFIFTILQKSFLDQHIPKKSVWCWKQKHYVWPATTFKHTQLSNASWNSTWNRSTFWWCGNFFPSLIWSTGFFGVSDSFVYKFGAVTNSNTTLVLLAWMRSSLAVPRS